MKRFILSLLFLLVCNTGYALDSTGACYGDDCKLLLHMNGTDASTTFTDTATSKTVSVFGNAQIDTAQSKFGSASGLFDGTGDYVTIADSDDWYYGTGDFTIDFWVRFNALPTSGNTETFYYQESNSNDLFTINLYNSTGTYQIFVAIGKSGNYYTLVGNTSLSTNTWYHIAVVRSSTTNFYTFVDGTALSLSVLGSLTSSEPVANLTGALYIGKYGPSTDYYFNGWFDEYRIVKGKAVWTSNFTPSTGEYNACVARRKVVTTVIND